MFYYGCQNCRDAMDHALTHGKDPRHSNFYTFCNNCSRPIEIFRNTQSLIKYFGEGDFLRRYYGEKL